MRDVIGFRWALEKAHVQAEQETGDGRKERNENGKVNVNKRAEVWI